MRLISSQRLRRGKLRSQEAAGGVWLDPVLPPSFGDLHITNAPLGGGRTTIDIANSVPSVHGLSEGMTLHQGHRPWMIELVEQAGHRRRERLENWGK